MIVFIFAEIIAGALCLIAGAALFHAADDDNIAWTSWGAVLVLLGFVMFALAYAQIEGFA